MPYMTVASLEMSDEPDLKQEFANDGFKGVTPPESAEAKIEKESESIAKMIDEGTKTIVEQNKN